MIQNHSKKVLSLAVAACFGGLAGQAVAAVTVGTSNPAMFAKEVNSDATLTNDTSVASIVVNAIPGLRPTSSTPMYVKVNLLNGAKWGATPSLICAASGVAGSAGVTMTGTIDNGGTTTVGNVTFRISGQLGMGTTDSGYVTTGCTVSAGSFIISGVTDKTVSAQVEYTNGASVATTAQVGSWISFQRGLSTTVSAPGTTVKVDATSGSDNWDKDYNISVGTALLGHITFGKNGVSATNSAGAANVENGGYLDSATLTVGGPAVAAMIAKGVSGMYLSTVVGCSDTTVTAAFTTSASSTSVTFTKVTGTRLSAGIYICGVVPGNVVITTGQLTATLGSVAAASTNITLDVSAPSNNIVEVTSNGSTRNAYFVNASTSTNKTSVLRIINRSGQAGALTASAYNEAGTLLGTANSSLGTLENNQMLAKTSAELETALGITGLATTAKYSVVISGALPSFEVLNFTKDNATGNLTLSNTSTTNTQ